MRYKSSVKFLNIFNTHVASYTIELKDNPEKFNSALLQDIRPIFRPFCVIKWELLKDDKRN